MDEPYYRTGFVDLLNVPINQNAALEILEKYCDISKGLSSSDTFIEIFNIFKENMDIVITVFIKLYLNCIVFFYITSTKFIIV